MQTAAGSLHSRIVGYRLQKWLILFFIVAFLNCSLCGFSPDPICPRKTVLKGKEASVIKTDLKATVEQV